MQLVVSSDRLSSVWQPLTTLDLSLSESGDKKHVQVELDQTELKKLITSLEAADRVCFVSDFTVLSLCVSLLCMTAQLKLLFIH